MHALIVLFFRGGLIMWPLLLCSILSVTVSFERLLFWSARSRSRLAAEPVFERVHSLVTAGETGEAQRILDDLDDPAAELLGAGLGGSNAAAAMERRSLPIMRACRRGLRSLETVIAIAPMLGLLGTVLGVIQSFGFLGGRGEATRLDVTGMAGGIAEALITTAFGLVIAIVSVIPHNYFSARVQREAEELTSLATSMEEALRNEDRVRT